MEKAPLLLRTENKPVEFSEALKQVGESGRFQILLLCICSLAGLGYMGEVLIYQFLVEKPYYCGELCAETNVSESMESIWNETNDPTETNITLTENIITEFNQCCLSPVIISLIESAYFAMYGVGGIIHGILSDKLGRKTVSITGSTVQLVIGISLAFSPNFTVFVVLRCTVGFFAAGPRVAGIVLVSEMLTSSWRPILMSTIVVGQEVAKVGFALLAYSFLNWRQLQLAIALIDVPFICIGLICLPESARWLAVTGKMGKAQKILNFAAKLNRRVYDKNTSLKVRNVPKGRVKDLFSKFGMGLKTVELCATFSIVSCVLYTSLSNVERYASAYVDSRLFIALVAVGTIAISAIPLPIYSHILNRKAVAMLFSSVTAVSLLLGAVVSGILRSIFGIIAIASITITFNMAYIRAGEIFPTSCRNCGIGLCNLSAGFGSLIYPFIDLLESALIYALFCVIATIIAAHLPETKGNKLPETVEEAEQIQCKWTMTDRKRIRMT